MVVETIMAFGLVVWLVIAVIDADRRRRRLAALVDELAASQRQQTAAQRDLSRALVRLETARAAEAAHLRAQIAELTAQLTAERNGR